MRPLAELATTGLRGLFTDIDDTLTENGVIAPATYAALLALRDAGLRVVLVTGRPAGWASTLGSLWPVDAAVGENGAVAFLPSEKRTLDELWFDDEAERKTWPDRLRAISDDVLQLPYARRTRDAFMRVADVAFDIGEAESLDPAQISEIQRRIESHGARFARSTIHAHGSYSAASKGKMIERLAAALWHETPASVREHYVFVGDSPNDESAFATLVHTVGVANVAHHVAALSSPPRYITPSPRGRGFCELVAHVLGRPLAS